MMRWLSWVVSVGFCLGMVAGCTTKVFVHKPDWDDANHLLPASIEEGQPLAGATPLTASTPTPADVNDAERPPRHITLQEAIAIALENGSSAGGARVPTGQADDNLVSLSLGQNNVNIQTDKLRVLAMNPAITAASLEQSIARFDAHWVSSLNSTNTDNLAQGLASFNNGQSTAVSTSLVKAFAPGGVASLGLSTEYRLLTQPPTSFGVLNPTYTSRLIFGFEQPLLQNAGVQINQLLNRTASVSGNGVPGDVANAYNSRGGVLNQLPQFTGNQTEGILVARLRLDAQRSEFERNVNLLLVNVEIAYWNLYQAYGQLYSFEEVLRVAHKSWAIFHAKFQAGTLKGADYYPVLAQYEEFRGNRLSSLGDVLDKERNLRRLIGLPTEDGTRLVPITPPGLTPFVPDWDSARLEALQRRPEMGIARDNLRAAQYNLIVAQNFLKPDMRFYAQYSPVGFGTRLDGNGTFTDGSGEVRTNNAFRSLAGDHFNDWKLGVNLTMPLGFRLEHAAIRAARLGLAQAYELIKDQEDRATSQLHKEYQKLAENYRLIEAHRAERKAYGDSVELRFREVNAGKILIDALLDSTRRLAAAQVKEYESIAQYNISMARFEWAKGTILQYDNVHIAEGPLPQCAQVRAVEHEAKRSKALVLCEKRPDAINLPGRCVAANERDIITAPVNLMTAPANEVLVPVVTPEAQKMPMAPAADPKQFPPLKLNSQSEPPAPKSVLVEMGSQSVNSPPQRPAGDTPVILPTLPEAPALQLSPASTPIFQPVPNQ